LNGSEGRHPDFDGMAGGDLLEYSQGETNGRRNVSTRWTGLILWLSNPHRHFFDGTTSLSGQFRTV